MRVRVHYNLHTLIWSVVALEGDDKGRVISRAECVVLTGAIKFHVGEKSRQRVIRDHCRSVHAYISGELQYSGKRGLNVAPDGISISYNPFKQGTFYERGSFAPVTEATRVDFDANGKGWNEVIVQGSDIKMAASQPAKLDITNTLSLRK
jgi:hypothetical protein